MVAITSMLTCYLHYSKNRQAYLPECEYDYVNMTFILNTDLFLPKILFE